MSALDHSISIGSEQERIAAINAVLGTARLSQSPLAPCVAPLLVTLNWMGAPRRLLSGLPPKSSLFDADALTRLMSHLGYQLRRRSWKGWPGQLETLPVGSIVQAADSARVYLGHSEGKHWWHDGQTASEGAPPAKGDTLLLVQADATYQPLDAPQTGWFGRLFLAARREIGGLMWVSLAANLLALVISLFTMFVYNTVIPSGARGTLWTLTAGAVIAICGAWGLRMARASLLAKLSGWAGVRISQLAMTKTLGLPLEVSARLGLENNLSRLRSLEGVRQWFGGGGGAVNIDYPFVLIFLLVIALLGGPIVFVPIVGLGLFALLSWPLSTLLNARASAVGRISRHLGEMAGVVSGRLRALRGVPATALWNRHLGELVAQSVALNRDYALANALTQTVGQALSMLIVLCTMGVGISLVLTQSMSTGGLIAAMMLIWRVTTPAQQFFASQVRVKQLLDSGRQLERLLATPGEASNPQLTSAVAELTPAVEADRLYYRHSADREPALAGVSFAVEAGQMLVVVGPNGAGKSTLLEVLAGVRPAQNGRVRIAGRDIRQFDPVDYRAWHGYLPQMTQSLPLTVREAVSLRRPGSMDSELAAALARVGGESWWRFFGANSGTEALDLRLEPWREDREATRSRYLVQLAAAILGDPPLVLLDDPIGDRDPALDPYLLRLLASLKGSRTVILATHRPDLIQGADLIAVLNDGALAHFGPIALPETPVAPQTPLDSTAATA
ncbi:ATP-binding cassette domain-containing protein [Roseateles sp. PN1]|uniref:ATP-binding cassette domain-containing protein n=1 Tax=Roseateles sp. PN1 TaxID=3137372 RepID=UPI003138D4E5